MNINQRTALVLNLVFNEEGTGRDIIKRAAAKGQKLSEGTIYPLLRELESEGLLACSVSEPLPERGGRRKFMYKLTGSGKTALSNYRIQTENLMGWAEPKKGVALA